MYKSKISVIVPVYRVERYLSRCVESLLNQTYSNIEIILVNDASPDKSAEIMEQYRAMDKRVKCVYQLINKGVSATRNRGLDEATGAWVAFCDGDDWYLSDAMEQMLVCAEEEQADYIVCNYQLVADGKPNVTVDLVDAIRDNLSNRNVIACGPTSSCCHLFSKELFDVSKVRYPEGVGHSEELPVVPVLAKYAHKIAVVDEALYCYYQRNSGSASNSSDNLEPEHLEALAAMEETLGNGYEQETTYRAIYCLYYGEILRMMKSNASRKEITERINKYEEKYPLYQKNQYYSNLGKVKRFFLWLERKRSYCGLKIFSIAHGFFVH